MRLDPAEGEPASHLVNRLSERELADIFFHYGEERFSRRVAHRIVETRKRQPFETTQPLAELVRRCVPRSKGQRIDPATRVFQALRIAVNDELGTLERLLQSLPACLKPGGRAVLISFHSLEDRQVKRAFADKARWQVLTKKPVTAGDAELQSNPRSRSAKLRRPETGGLKPDPKEIGTWRFTMQKSSIVWLIVGMVLGAGSAVIAVGVRQSSSTLTAGEAQAVAEIHDLLGDPSPSEDSGHYIQRAPEYYPPTPPFPLQPELAQMEKQQELIETATGERIHAPKIIEPLEDTPVSIPARPTWSAPPLAGDHDLPFTGTHKCQLEKMGKIHLPEGVGQQLKIPPVLFVMAGPDGCIELYPPIALDHDAAGRKLGDEAARRQRRLWYSRVTAVRVEQTPEGSSLVLPKALIEQAGLDGYLKIIGVGDRFEIWDAERWQEYVDGQEAEVISVEPACWNPDAPF